MGAKVEVLEEFPINASFHHEDNRIVTAALDDDFDGLALAKLFVNGCDFEGGLESVDGAQDTDLATGALVVDVLDDHAHVRVDAVVRADVGVELVEAAVALGQVCAAFLNGAIFVVLPIEAGRQFGSDHQTEVVGPLLPLGDHNHVVLSRL